VEAALTASRWILFAVFALAAVAKLIDLQGTRRSLSEFGVPPRLVGALALLLPAAELAVAVALVPAASAPWGGVAAALLLGVFGAAIARSLAAGRTPDCHCFGNLHSAPAGWPTLLRNLGLLMVAVFTAAAGFAIEEESLLAWTETLDPVASAALIALVGVIVASSWIILALLRRQGALLLRLDELEAGGEGTATARERIELFARGLPDGTPAPPFDLPSVRGGRRTSEDLLAAGRPLALIFVNPGCGPCIETLEELRQGSGAGEVSVVVIGSEDDEENRSIADAFGIEEFLLEDERSVSRAYLVTATPSMVMVSAAGEIHGEIAQGPAAIARMLSEAGSASGAGLELHHRPAAPTAAPDAREAARV
jgi:thiol-disulfide isomerase/thioredoxin